MNLRSIVPKTVIWLIGAVAVVLIGLSMTAHIAASHSSGLPEFITATQQLQIEMACRIYEREGRESLRKYLERLDELFHGKHYLVDRNSRDLSGDRDMSELSKRVQSFEWNRDIFRGDVVFERRSEDEEYRLLIEIIPPIGRWEILPYFGWILVMVVAMGYGFAVNIVRPLKRLQNAVVQLGGGKLDSRVDFNRRDEFGELGRAFDQMAQRIESLLTAERLLLQDISHELRSPLTRLRFALDLARGKEPAESAFQRVDREVSRLADLVGQLLQLTRAEGDITARTMIDISLPDLISESIDDFQLEAASKQCSVAWICLETQMLVRGEPELVRRAFENVLSNALRHAPSGSKITVNLLRDGRNAAISIRDHGSGVPEEMMPEIFKPFRRVDCDRNRDSGGVGLGLSIARRAVHLHHGTITARNAHPGLEVLLVLPLGEPKSEGGSR